jgi:hypothetical protein
MYTVHKASRTLAKKGAVPMRAPRRRRRRARHLQPSCPGHLPVPLHSLELHREALHGRRGALLVPHAELGHGRRPLSIILAKNPIWMACQSCLHMRVCIDDSCNAETEPAVGETETHRRVVLRGGGPRMRSRRRVVVMLPRCLLLATVSAAAVPGRGRVMTVSPAVAVMGACLRLVLRRRSELALLGAPTARLAAAAPGLPVGVGLPVRPPAGRRRPR